MEGFLRILVFLVIAAVWLISAIAKARAAGSKKDERQGGGWRQPADAEEIRNFLQQGGSRPTVGRPQARSGAAGMPMGTVTPTARRQAQAPPPPRRPQYAADQGRKRESAAARGAQGSSPKRPVTTRSFSSQRPAVKGSLERHMDAIEAASVKAHGPTAAVQGAMPAAPTGKGVAAAADAAAVAGAAGVRAPAKKSRFVPEINRHNLRQAIVMREVLGPPLALREPA